MITILLMIPLLLCVAVAAGGVYLFLKAKPLALRYNAYTARRISQQDMTRPPAMSDANITFMTIFIRAGGAIVSIPAGVMFLVLLVMMFR